MSPEIQEDREKFEQLLEEAFRRYADSHTTLPPQNSGWKLLSDSLPSVRPMMHSRLTFQHACKESRKFAEEWGLKFEERWLSLEERVLIYREKTRTENGFFPILKETLYFHGIPTKLVTLISNNERASIYEY